MTTIYLLRKHINISNTKNKIEFFLLNKEQLKYLKTMHSYHLVDSSPWPFVAALSGFMLTSGLIMYLHRFVGGFNLFICGLLLVLYVMFT